MDKKQNINYDAVLERMAKIETMVVKNDVEMDKMKANMTEIMERVSRLEEANNWIKEKINNIDKKLWGVITGIIISILLMIIKSFI